MYTEPFTEDDDANAPAAYGGGVTELDPLTIPPFRLKDVLHERALDAVRRGAITSTISIARGDPDFPAPMLAMRLYEYLFALANELAELRNTPAQIALGEQQDGGATWNS